YTQREEIAGVRIFVAKNWTRPALGPGKVPDN
ncbi:MAG: hypothetical protein QOE34_1267, partial [Verrucomicrobiota bacterium]